MAAAAKSAEPKEAPAPAAASAAPAAPDYTKLNKIQKLAALLVMLGPDPAASVLKSLDPHEVDAVSAEMAKLDMVPHELQLFILKEFSEVAVRAGTSMRGGVEVTRASLEKALGLFRASDIIGRVAPTRAPVAAMASIADMDARQIFNLIRHEQAQTIALVLSYVSPDKAAAVFTLLRPEQRDQIIERLATLAPTPVEVVEKVVEVLTAKLGVNQTRALNQTGGVKTAADILNAMDKAQSKSLLLNIESRNPELTQAIRQKMFTFEDLVTLDPPTLQRILREVDMRDLAVALKTASDKLKAMLLASISKRAAEAIAEEIAFMGPIKLRDIESAQLRVIDIVRKLEADGEIDLGEARNSFQYEGG
jgi:flagellar motor switch protein FliG